MPQPKMQPMRKFINASALISDMYPWRPMPCAQPQGQAAHASGGEYWHEGVSKGQRLDLGLGSERRAWRLAVGSGRRWGCALRCSS